MTRNLALLLTSVLLVFTLTACGGNQKNNTANNGNGTTATDNNGGTPGNNTNGQNGTTDNGLIGDMEQAGGDLVNGAENAIDDVLPGNQNNANNNTTGNGTTNQANATVNRAGTAARQAARTGGVSYGQMLQNAWVHDTDGILTDHENSVTAGWAY